MRHTAVSVAVILAFALGLSACSTGNSGKTQQATVQHTSSSTGQANNPISSAVDTVGTGISDTAITTSVKTQLFASLDTGSTSISVTTNHGVVTLSGSVQTDAQKDSAEKTANNVAGVEAVTNNINVVSN